MNATAADRILTTHAGSLPRHETLSGLLIRREEGEGVDAAELAREMDGAVARVTARQAECGVDIANDGEQQRVGFSTYIAQRMEGFGGESKRRRSRDYEEFPELVEVLARRFPHRSRMQNAPQAQGELRYRGASAIAGEIERLKRSVPTDAFSGCFLTAPSPGIVSTTMLNAYYDSHESYLAALAREMRHEYHTRPA